ncbi:unnamed protein product [Effrenium voratum]|nr:unnamed protein product [Effrenium voratum]
MLGVFTGEMAARSFHEKLVKRLGLNRSRWLDHQLASAMEKVLQEVSSESIQVSVIATFGGRACGVATPEAAFRLSLRPTQAGGLLKPTATAVPTASSRSRCLVLRKLVMSCLLLPP